MILIKGGKIKPITGAEIENGELLIGDDGKIAAIGKTMHPRTPRSSTPRAAS